MSITTTPTVRSQQFAVKREGSGDRDVTSDTVHDTGTDRMNVQITVIASNYVIAIDKY